MESTTSKNTYWMDFVWLICFIDEPLIYWKSNPWLLSIFYAIFTANRYFDWTIIFNAYLEEEPIKFSRLKFFKLNTYKNIQTNGGTPLFSKLIKKNLCISCGVLIKL